MEPLKLVHTALFRVLAPGHHEVAGGVMFTVHEQASFHIHYPGQLERIAEARVTSWPPDFGDQVGSFDPRDAAQHRRTCLAMGT